MIASVSSDGRFNAKLKKFYGHHYLLIENSNTEVLITGDFLIAGLFRYSHVWEKYFAPLNALHFVIGVGHIENV